MKQSRFTDSQIVAVLKEGEAGVQVSELHRLCELEAYDRTEVLDAYLFDNICQVQEITEQWLYEYNENRPHESLGNIPPTQFMPRLTTAPILYNQLST